MGTVLVSDSDVESSMSEGQTSTLCNACKREIQQCSWLELTTSLKHLLICGLVRWEDSTVMTWPVLEIEFAMALNVSPVSHSLEPNVVKGGMAPSRRLRQDLHVGKE